MYVLEGAHLHLGGCSCLGGVFPTLINYFRKDLQTTASLVLEDARFTQDAFLICGPRVRARGLEPPQRASGKTGHLKWPTLFSRSVENGHPSPRPLKSHPGAPESLSGGSKEPLGGGFRDPELLKRGVGFRGP